MAWVLLAMIVVGLFMGATVSIKNGPRGYGYFFVYGERRPLRQDKPDTTHARAERAIAAWPYLIAIGTGALVVGYVAALAGLVVIAIIALIIAVLAGAGVLRAEWLAAHADRWHLDD